MKSSTPRRDNHYTPQAHLRRFADPSDSSGRIWVYDRAKPYKDQPKRRFPSQIGKQYDLYVRQCADSGVDDALERWFSKEIDGPAAGAIAKLGESGPTSLLDVERHAVARYLAAQDIRTPSSRLWIRESVQRVNPSLSEHAFNEEWLEYLRVAPDQIATHIERAGWKIIQPPPDISFLTSDIGLAKVLKDIGRAIPYAPGWNGSDKQYRHWVFPLDPRSVLYISPGISDGTISDAKRSSCRAMNQRMIEQSLRYVFASSRDQDVQQMVTGPHQLAPEL